jgi:hypothetical protein
LLKIVRRANPPFVGQKGMLVEKVSSRPMFFSSLYQQRKEIQIRTTKKIHLPKSQDPKPLKTKE